MKMCLASVVLDGMCLVSVCACHRRGVLGVSDWPQSVASWVTIQSAKGQLLAPAVVCACVMGVQLVCRS